MKKLVLLICLFNLQFNFAQNTYPFPANGNVGIGTTNPATTLDVFGAARFKVPDDQSGNSGIGFSIETNSGTNLKMGGNYTYSWIQSHAEKPLYINELGNNTIINLLGGNVGIGTKNPNAKLYVGGGDVIIHNPTGSAISTGVLRGDNFNYGNGGAIRFGSSNTVSEQYIQLGEAQSGTGNFTPVMTVLGTIAGGKVGIGTNPHNTGDKFHVDGGDLLVSKDAGGGVTHGIIRGDNANYGNGGAIRFSSSNTVSEQYIQFGEAQSGTGNFTPVMTVLGTIAGGKVGIGTNPHNTGDKFHVDGGDLLVSKDAGGGVTHGIIRGDNANYGNGGAIRFSSSNTVSEQYIQFGEAQSGTGNFTPVMTVLGTMAGGNVGIGKTNPNNKLDVNGTVHSKEVKVDMNGWSDFVFKKEYTLPTLEEVEKQINEKGHLANIPSEEEVLKNGINLGEMNAKLLQKVEELTLYVIEQNKKINELEMKNKKYEGIENRLKKIESKIN